MKQLRFLFAALLMVATTASFTACGSDDDDASDPAQTTTDAASAITGTYSGAAKTLSDYGIELTLQDPSVVRIERITSTTVRVNWDMIVSSDGSTYYMYFNIRDAGNGNYELYNDDPYSSVTVTVFSGQTISIRWTTGSGMVVTYQGSK